MPLMLLAECFVVRAYCIFCHHFTVFKTGLNVCLYIHPSPSKQFGFQSKYFLDNWHREKKQCGIDPSALGDDTQDRSAWRTLCHEAVTQFEDSRVEALAHKRAVRKGAQPRSNLSAWPCDSCPRVCSSRIGLHAHQQTHR